METDLPPESSEPIAGRIWLEVTGWSPAGSRAERCMLRAHCHACHWVSADVWAEQWKAARMIAEHHATACPVIRERAKIVAWLRDQAEGDPLDADVFADLIEKGEHDG